jgi:hypothetical protein
MRNNGVLFSNTLVGLFDIQAYSEFIEKSSTQEAIEKTSKLYKFARSSSTTNFGSVKTKFWVLSDTVVMAIDTAVAPLSFASTYFFSYACSDLFHGALRFCGLPMRGAIGFGDLYFEEDSRKNEFGDGSFLLGSGLVDAAKHEREQNWLGMRYTPKAVQALEYFESGEDGKKILDCKKLESVCEFGEIPLKGGLIEKGYYIVPFKRYPDWRSYLPPHFEDKNGKLAVKVAI